jgi:hypothetical protein
MVNAKKTYTDVTEEKSSLRIFTDPKLQEAIENDPFFAFVSNNWRPVIIALVIAGAGIYGRGLYREAVRTSAERSAEAYSKVRNEFDQVSALKSQVAALAASSKEEDKKKVEEKTKDLKAEEEKLRDAVRVLSDGDEPYRSLGALYATVLGTAGANIPDWSSIKDAKSRDRLFSELNALAAARQLLDQPDKIAAGKSALQALAADGMFVKVPAAIAYAKVASDDKERADALGILSKIKETEPEQADLIENEVKRLGGV